MIRRPRRATESHRASGFTLIEVLIAVAILGIATTAIFASFGFQHRSYLVQNAVAEMQQNLRGGMQFLEMDARNAGARLPASMKIPALLLEGGTISMISGLGIADGGAGGPDNLYIIYPSPITTWITDSMPNVSAEIKTADPSAFQIGTVAIIFDSTNADVFQVTQVQFSDHLQHNDINSIFGTDNKSFSKAYGEGSTVALIRYSGYFLDTATDPAHPKLMRKVIGDNTLTPQIVADDIEDLQIRLVLDDKTERDGAGIDNTTLGRVRQIRIYLAARTATADLSWNEGPVVPSTLPHAYNRSAMGGLAAYNHHRRRYFEQIIDLRNTGLTP